MTDAQQSAVLDWMTQITHGLVELNPGNAVPLLESLSEVKKEFGIVESVGEPT